MKNFIIILYTGISNFVYFAKSNHSLKNKFKIYFTYLKINFKSLVLSKFFKFKSENIMGFKISTLNYSDLRFLFEEVFYKNEYFIKINSEKPIIFDCGANIGFATIFLKWVYPDSEIYSFEPDKKTFDLLSKNVGQNNLKNVHLFNCAVSNFDGQIDFYNDVDNPGSLLMSTKPERTSMNVAQVKSISISSFMTSHNIESLDLLKIDIEGSEKEVVEDLEKSRLIERVSKVILEYHHHIDGQRSELGYFLKIFEANNFNYQLDTNCFPIGVENKFQDVLIYFYK
jgi:FkbM family methyltransferase